MSLPTSELAVASSHNRTRSRPILLTIGLLSALIIGIVDYLTGVEINLAVFYLVPISFVTWFVGPTAGVLTSALSAAAWLANDFLLVERYSFQIAIAYSNAVLRFGVFVFVVILLSRLKTSVEHEKESSRVKTDMLSLVGHSNLAISSTLDLYNAGKSLLETITVFFPGCASTIRLFNAETGALGPLASRNLNEQEWTAELPNLPVGREVLEVKAPLVIRNLQTDPRTSNIDYFRKNGLVSYLGLPLIARGDLLGTLSLYSRNEREFTKEEIGFFTILGGQAAIALQNARLFEEVRVGQTQLRALSRRLLEAQESERRRVARELHDEIGQILTGLRLTLEATARLPSQEASAKLVEARALVNELIMRARGISLDLRPSMLDDLGLLPTLLWHFERYTASTQVKVTFSHSGLEGKRFPPQVETAAYRIVQEALTNVARHAGVNQATVRVYVWPDYEALTIEIEDEGVGFDPETATRAGAGGLAGMRERTMLLGGRLAVKSAPGAGASVTAELPLSEPSERERPNG